METVKSFGSLDVESFGVSHDAAEPMFYVFHYNGRKLALITDTGYVSDRMKGIIRSANAFVLKAIMMSACCKWAAIRGTSSAGF